ncbi:MAG: hypothetical protein HY795_12620 [Desulfovibrio sp.]|nr:hypothetical protein [Desulfovibrio sp.]MBI4960143.1 hypothetical protein [Desulfovibrio sp.]
MVNAISEFISKSAFVEATALAITISAVSAIMLRYLMGIQKSINKGDDSNADSSASESNAKYFERLLKSYKELSIDTTEKKKISRSVLLFEELYDRVRFSRTRLRNNLKTLTMHAVVNLVLAVFVIFVTLFLLVYLTMVSFKDGDLSSQQIYSRIILLGFAQFTTFIFMKIYRSLMSDIKYIVNEITNIEQKYIALHAACIFSENKSLDAILNKLVNCERNFILKKGETTPDIEKERISQLDSKNYLGYFRKGFFKR